MKLYDNISQNYLNSLIYCMLHNFQLENSLSFNQLDNDYCTLIFDKLNNQDAGDEYIVTGDFKVNLSNVKYSNVDYYVKLYYYDLADGDIDDSYEYDILKEKVVKLTVGDNMVSFDEDIVYLQLDFDLLVGGG